MAAARPPQRGGRTTWAAKSEPQTCAFAAVADVTNRTSPARLWGEGDTTIPVRAAPRCQQARQGIGLNDRQRRACVLVGTIRRRRQPPGPAHAGGPEFQSSSATSLPRFTEAPANGRLLAARQPRAAMPVDNALLLGQDRVVTPGPSLAYLPGSPDSHSGALAISRPSFR